MRTLLIFSFCVIAYARADSAYTELVNRLQRITTEVNVALDELAQRVKALEEGAVQQREGRESSGFNTDL